MAAAKAAGGAEFIQHCPLVFHFSAYLGKQGKTVAVANICFSLAVSLHMHLLCS